MKFVKSRLSNIIDFFIPIVIVAILVNVIMVSNRNMQLQVDHSGSEYLDIIEYTILNHKSENIEDIHIIDYMNAVDHKKAVVYAIYNERLEKLLPDKDVPDPVELIPEMVESFMTNESGYYRESGLATCNCYNRYCNIYFRWIDSQFGRLLLIYGICSDSIVGKKDVSTWVMISIIMVLIFSLKITFFNRWIHMKALHKAYMDRFEIVNFEIYTEDDSICIREKGSDTND